MRWIAKKYQVISIWLSLVILTLAFIVGSDQSVQGIGVPFTFLAGMLLYLAGAVRDLVQSHMAAALIQMMISVCMLAGMTLSLLHLGGVL